MVAAGHYGRKSGQGFYAGKGEAPEPQPDGRFAQMVREEELLDLGEMLVAPQIDDAMRMLGDGYATADDIDTAMRFGCGYPKGPTELLAERGATPVVATLMAMSEYSLTTISAPAPLLVDRLPDAEADGRLLEHVPHECTAREADDDDDDAADGRRQVREQVFRPALEQAAAQDAQRARGEDQED